VAKMLRRVSLDLFSKSQASSVKVRHNICQVKDGTNVKGKLRYTPRIGPSKYTIS